MHSWPEIGGLAALVALSGCGAGERPPGTRYDDGRISPSVSCQATGGAAEVAAPVFLRNLPTGETCWFSSPAAVDLDRDGRKEIVAPCYSTFVFDAGGALLGKGTATAGRVYAPAVVADLDGDGQVDIVVGGNRGTVAAYQLRDGALELKPGWPASTCSGAAHQCPEARGMAAGDLDRDGRIEVAVTTTQTEDDGAQVFVFSPDGTLYQPSSAGFPAWPRYNARTGEGGDAGFNGQGNHGYGCYGENVGIGNLDDDPDLEVIVTYDNHQINAFKKDGTSILASDYYTNHRSEYLGRRLGWGQFIRWLDPAVEEEHYHAHGEWPDVRTTMWLQWTASPPSVADIDGDGKNEVVGLPNAEMKEPYETQAHAFMVLQGAHGDGSRSARRLPAFDRLPLTFKPEVRPDGDWYPPDPIPAPVPVNILGDGRSEIVAATADGYLRAVGPDATELWRYDYSRGASRTFASEPAIADLNGDGRPEIVFGTYALSANAGRLVVLANTGALLHELALPGQRRDGNGVGVAAAPTVADLDGDGQLEIVLMTFDHGLDVFTVPGSSTGCLPWPTGRGSPLRAGTGPSTAP